MKRIRKKKSARKKRKSQTPKQEIYKSVLLRESILSKGKYKQLHGATLTKFRKASMKLKDKNFKVELYKRIKIKEGGFRQLLINVNQFRAGMNVAIYITHKPSKQRRLLGIGKFQDLPILSKQAERFGRQLSGRTFDPKLPYPKRRKGKWIPVSRITDTIQKELEEMGKDMRTEVRGSIIPMRRYFHTGWRIYSDKPLSGGKWVKKVFVHCVVYFDYPDKSWLGKQSVLLVLEEPTRIRDLYKMRADLEDLINSELHLYHPNAATVSSQEVNGFIPFGED